MSDNNSLTINPPLHLVCGDVECWQCKEMTIVGGLVAPNVEGPEPSTHVLSHASRLPDDLLNFIQERLPTFVWKNSKTAGHSYYANTCTQCGALIGDHHLGKVGAIFGLSSLRPKMIRFAIPITSPIVVTAGYSVGTGDEILHSSAAG